MRKTTNSISCKIYKNICIVLCIISVFLYSLCVPFYAQDVESNEKAEESNKNVFHDDIEHKTDLEVEAETKEKSELNAINAEEPTLLKGYVSKIPSGTKFRIILETPIDEVTNKIDDEISGKTSENVVIDGNVVVPANSVVVGKISEVNPAKRLHKAGTVRIEFKSLTTPDGRQIPIVASVLSRSGLVKGKFTKKAALIAGATIVGPAAAGLGAGLAAEGSAVGATIGAVVGVLAGIGLFAFQRGNMVDIKAGDEMDIELVEEALVPKFDENAVKEPVGDAVETESAKNDFIKPDTTEIDFSETILPGSSDVMPEENPLNVQKEP